MVAFARVGKKFPHVLDEAEQLRGLCCLDLGKEIVGLKIIRQQDKDLVTHSRAS